MTATFLDLVDLASERLGGAVVAANDEFFAPKEHLISAGRRRLDRGRVHRPRQMDGRLGDAPPARRRRSRLVHRPARRARRRARRRRRHGVFQGQLSGVVRRRRVRPPRPCATADELSRVAWREVAAADAARRRLAQPDCRGRRAPGRRTCVCASFRTAASPGCASTATSSPDWDRLRTRGDVDLAAVEHGGLVVACSDMFFGSRHNLIMPGDATHMGDGWETKRRRGPGHDWTIVRLGAAGAIRRVEVDTRHFKGNAPGACSLEGAAGEAAGRDLAGLQWRRSAAAHRPPAAYQARLRGRPAAARRRHARAVQYLSRRRRRAAAPVWPAT